MSLLKFKLDEIADVVDCEHKTAPKIESGDFYSIRTPDIKNGRLLYEQANRVTEETYKLWTKRAIPEEGDIILAREAPVGEVGWIDKNHKICLGQRTVLIKVHSLEIDKKYLLYSFVSPKFKQHLNELSGGSVVSHLNMKDIRALEFEFPPLPEQQAIASVLSVLDDKIDLLQRQNQTLEQMAATLFRQWFIEEAKEDWESYFLEDLANIYIGRTPPRKESQWFSRSNDDVKWISIKDLGDKGIFTFRTSENISKEAIETFNIPIIPKDTVILSFKMTVGRVGISSEDMTSNEAIAQFQIKKLISKEFLYCFLKQYNFDTLGSTSSIVTAINTALIRKIEVNLPDKELIEKFNTIVKGNFNKVRFNQIQIQTLQSTRDTLLPKLISGEVRLKGFENEV